jgi:hypothetical protein
MAFPATGQDIVYLACSEENKVMEENMEEKIEEKYPLAAAIEKAGYQILSLSCITEKIYDQDRDKSVDRPVISMKIMPNKELKIFSMAD